MVETQKAQKKSVTKCIEDDAINQVDYGKLQYHSGEEK